MGNFDDSQHPRGEHGKFSTSGSGRAATRQAAAAAAKKAALTRASALSTAAHDASAKAAQSGAPGDHADASRAHQDAATTMRRLGQSQKAGRHQELAAAHAASATAPGSTSGHMTLEDLIRSRDAMAPTARERDAVLTYTGGDHAVINGDLRTGRTERLSDRLKSTVSAMDALAARSRLTSAVTTYRGVGPNATAIANLKVGETFVDHGFVSTSVDRGVIASRFNDAHILHVTSPAGIKAIPNPSEEKELILGRGVAMRLDHREETTTNGQRQSILHVTVVGQQ